MGVPDIYLMTEEGSKNFRAAIEAEERARLEWMEKWGWILDEYKKINQELTQLKKGRRFTEEVVEYEDKRTIRPFSDTEGHEYGFLASKPEFRLEIFPPPKELSQAQFYKLVDEHMEETMKERRYLDKIHRDPVSLDGAFKEIFIAEERAASLWHMKWSWLLEEYRKIYDELKALKEQKAAEDNIFVEKDCRTIRPYPKTTGHEYGYLCSKPEFVLERYSSPRPLKKSLTKSELNRALDERLSERFLSDGNRQAYSEYYRKPSNSETEHNHYTGGWMTLC